jgi:hypothetical protein
LCELPIPGQDREKPAEERSQGPSAQFPNGCRRLFGVDHDYDYVHDRDYNIINHDDATGLHWHLSGWLEYLRASRDNLCLPRHERHSGEHRHLHDQHRHLQRPDLHAWFE